MKIKKIILGIFALSPLGMTAQWNTANNTAGTVPYFYQGNIGINIPAPSTNVPAQQLHVVGKTRLDVGIVTGANNGRLFLTRNSNVNTECLISFSSGPFATATSSFDWIMGTYANATANTDWVLGGSTAGRAFTILQSNGYVGIGASATSPIARLQVGGDALATGKMGIGISTLPITTLQVNGDVTLGSATNNRKWRFITQNWIDGGKLFLQPDVQDGSGNADGTQGMTIDPIWGYTDFGQQGGITNLSIGNGNTINTTTNNGTSYIGFNAQRNKSTGTWVSSGTASNNGGGIIWGNTDGGLSFSPSLKVSGTNTYSDAAVVNRKTMEVRWNYTDGIGQVVIGPKTITTGTNTNFRLSVDGKIMAKEVVVVNDNTWADYVFNTDYKLRKLEEVEKYIAQNKHLPNVPSASEIATNGNNIGETEKILLEKIEELTLYMIEQNKKINDLQKQIDQK